MVVGLGNPGAEYESSRHNVGFLVVEALAGRAGIVLTRRRYYSLFKRGRLHGEEILLVKPLTFMNESGSAVSAWQQALDFEPARIIVVHDDLDLPTSQLRIKAGGGHGGHKGVRSVVQALGCADFQRVKVGIGRPGQGRDPVEHVLGPFEEGERDEMNAAVRRAADAVEVLLQEGLAAAMNRYNVRATHPQGRTEHEGEVRE
jgi:PTH1 family peptidyl-tRNA hydrolase